MCGAVRYELAEPPGGIAYCHCTRCQRRTGTGFSMSALTVPGSFSLLEGAEQVETYEPGDGWRKSFCGRCGSHLFTRDPEDESRLAVRVGTLDEDPGDLPGLHQFVAYAPAWSPVPDDGLPRFPERAGAD